MFYFLLALLILDAFLLMTVVLLQAGKGGGLAAMGGGGGDTLLGGRQAVTLLTRATWWTGGVFLVLCFILSIMSRSPLRTDPLLRGDGRPATTVPAPSPAPGVIGEPTAPTTGQLSPGPGTTPPAEPATTPPPGQ